MEEIKVIGLASLVMAAVLCDVKTGKISNGIIVTGLLAGLSYQIINNMTCGIIRFLGGALFPVLLFSLLFYFRMIGAGDIKLFSVVGGFLGPTGIWHCIIIAYLCAGVFSVYRMWKYHMFQSRMLQFGDYVREYAMTKSWSSYMAEAPEQAKFCFSVPIFASVFIYCVGGVI